MLRATLIVGLLFVTGAFAEYGWKPREEYRFQVEGSSLTGLAIKPQYAGIHYQGELRIQAQSSDVLYMKLQDMTYIKIHEVLPNGWWEKVSNSDSPFRDLPITRTTIVLKLDRGQVESVSMDQEVDDWERNFVHGLVSQLQMDLVGSNAMHDPNKNIQHRMEKDTSVYKVMEDSVLGNCEVLYEVAPYSKAMVMANNDFEKRDDLCGNRNYLEITKTRNFSNCEANVEYHFGLPSSKKCQPGGAQCGDFWSRSSVTRVLGCGERKDFLILNSVRSSRLMTNLHFHNASQATVNSYLNLTLISVKPISRRFSPPSESVSEESLVYKYSGFGNSSQKSSLSSNCKGRKYEAVRSVDIRRPNSHDSRSFEDSDYTTPVPKQKKQSKREKSKRENSKRRTSGIIMDTPSSSRTSKKKQKEERKNGKSSSTPESESWQSTEESNEKEDKKIWNLSKDDFSRAPHMPFSPFTLAYRQENEGSCLVQQFKDLVSEIINDFEAPNEIPEKMTMEKLYIAVQMCQTMSLFDLRKIMTGVVDSQVREAQRHLTERKIYRDILTMCGTNPAFQIIKSWIEEKIITGEEAAEMITSLPSHMQTPDVEAIKCFYDLIRSPAVREDQQLKISSILAFSNLLRVACVNSAERQARYPTNIIGSICSSKEASRYIPWLIKQLQTESELRLVYINALGNTGSRLVLPTLQNVAENSNYSPIQRASAVFAMKFQIFQDSATAIPILLSLFHNTGNPTSVRIAAVSMLLYARPPLSIWQRIAISTWYEPNPAIAAFVRSSLSSLSTVNDPVYKELSQSAFSVFSLSKPVSLSPHRAYNMLRTSIVESLQQVILEQFSWIPGPDASNIYYRHTQRLAGFSDVRFEGEMWLMNPDAFFTVLQELVYPSDDVTRARPMIKNLSRSTRWIRDTLKIEPRLLPKLEGALRFKFNQLSERLFAFDKKMSIDLAKAGRSFLGQLKGGKQFHFQKMDQTSLLIATSTEMGFPINMHVHVPWAYRAVGNAALNNNTKEFNLEATVTLTSQLIADVSIFTEWDQTVHVSASYGVSLINLPSMSYRAKLNKPMSIGELGFSMMDTNENNVIIHHSSRSFTAQQDAFNLRPWSISKSTRVLRMNEPNQEEVSIFPHVRLSFSIENTNKAPYDYQREVFMVQGFPMMWSSMESNSFEVQIKDLSAVTIDMGLASATMDNGQIHIRRRPGSPDIAFNNGTKKPTTTTTTTSRPDSNESNDDTTETATTAEAVTDATTDTETTMSSTTKQETSTSEPTTTESEYARKKPDNRHQFTADDAETYAVDYQDDPGNFNASGIDPFSDQGYETSYNYILDQVLKGVGQGQAIAIGINMTVHSEEPKEYMAFVTCARGMAERFHRVGFFFKDKKMNDQTARTASMYTPPTPIINFNEMLGSNSATRFYADYDYKYESDHETISLKGTISKSERKNAALRHMMMRNSSSSQKCVHSAEFLSPKCYQLMQDASILNQYNITINYNDKAKKSFGDLASYYMDKAKYTMLPYISSTSEVDSEDEDIVSDNTIHVNMDVDDTGNTVDVKIQSPSAGIQFSGMPVNSLMTTALRHHPEYSLAQRLMTTGYCGFSNNSVITYDGVQFQYSPGNCWHVFTKDCSGKSRVAVLVRNSGNGTNSKELEVNLDNYRVVSLKPGPEIYVNQRQIALKDEQVAEVKDQDGTKLVQMSASRDRAIKMVLPSHGFVIIYSNSTVIVQADVGTQGRLCGICGDNNNKQVNEFKSPRGKIEPTAFEFASSYILKDAECKEHPSSG